MINLANHEFTSKKHLEEVTREMFLNIPKPTVIDRSHMLWQFMYELISRHPERDHKFKNGIQYFIITVNKIRPQFTECHYVDNSDVEHNFSWVKCCRARPVAGNFNLLNAMRNTIANQVISWKHKQTVTHCEQCESQLDLHVDHKDVSFDQIVKDFLALEENIPTEFDDHSIKNSAVFKKQDEIFKHRWADFHNIKATYQLLCAKCNIKKSNRSSS